MSTKDKDTQFMQWLTMMTIVVKRILVFFYLNNFYRKYHDFEDDERRKRVNFKRVFDTFLSITVYVLFFSIPKEEYNTSAIGMLFIEIELICYVLEPLFFEIYFPWLAKEKIEIAA